MRKKADIEMDGEHKDPILEGLEVLVADMLHQYDRGMTWATIGTTMKRRLLKLQWKHEGVK